MAIPTLSNYSLGPKPEPEPHRPPVIPNFHLSREQAIAILTAIIGSQSLPAGSDEDEGGYEPVSPIALTAIEAHTGLIRTVHAQPRRLAADPKYLTNQQLAPLKALGVLRAVVEAIEKGHD